MTELEDQNDETSPKKQSEKILAQQMEEGTTALERETLGLFLSGVSAGLDIGFTLFAISIFATLAGWAPEEATFRMTMAALYPVGYIFVILGGSELFTEHTTLAVLPVLDGQATVKQLATLWGCVYSGNMLGAIVFGAVYALIAPAIGFATPDILAKIGHELAAPSFWMILVSGILAGWLMGLLSWLVTASRDTVSQILMISLVTGVIGLGPLHHCVVGAAELTAALTVGGIGLTAGLVALGGASLGNAIGGVLFVALLKYSLVIRSRYQRTPMGTTRSSLTESNSDS